jgi:hypothetical protein
VTAHVVAESLGYATPSRAAMIGLDGLLGRPNYCEWIDCCYRTNARQALQDAIRRRHNHHGYMAEYKLARALVDKVASGTHDGDWLASWF